MFFVYLLFFIVLIEIIALNSIIEFDVQNFTILIENKEIKKDIKITIKLKLFGFITALKFRIDNKKIDLYKKNLKVKKEIGKIRKNPFNLFEKAKFDFKNINLNLKIGTENVALTSITVGILSFFSSYFFYLLKLKKSKLKWTILPIYQNKNILYFKFNCIANIKLIYIISNFFHIL